MSRLTDDRLKAIWNEYGSRSEALRAVADAAVAAYIKRKKIEFPVAKRWKGEVPKSLGGGHIWNYISRDEKVPEGAYSEPLFTHPSYPVESKNCVNHEKCQALANAVLNDMDCHPAFVKAMAQGHVPGTNRMMVPVDMFLELAELAEEYATQGCIVATSTERELTQLLPRIRALIASQKEQQS